MAGGAKHLRTRAPVGQQCEQVEDADGAVAVEVRRAAGVAAPRGQQRKQIEDTDADVAIEVPGSRSGGAGSIKEVDRAGVDAVVVIPRGPNDGDVAADRDGEAESVFRRPVVR